MATQISDTAGLILIDLTQGSRTILLPSLTSRPGRVITIKDQYGYALTNPLIINVNDNSQEQFENGASSYTLVDPYGFITIISDPASSSWRFLGKSTSYIAPTFNILSTGVISSAVGTFSTISTNSILAVFMSSISTVGHAMNFDKGYINSAYISSLSVGYLIANHTSTTFTQDISYLIADDALVSTMRVQDMLTMASSFGTVSYLSSLFVMNLSAPVVTIGLSTLSTNVALANSNLVSSVQGLGTASYVSSPSLTSSIEGLGSVYYVSSLSLVSTVAGLGTTFYISSLSLTSTTVGLGSINYVSTLSLISTTAGLGMAGYVSTLSLRSSIVSTTAGLGSASYVSSLSLTSTSVGLGTAGYVSSLSLLSTTVGLGNTGYVSSLSLFSTVAGLGTATYVSSPSLTSSLAGLGNAGYVSTVSLYSTLAGLGTLGYISTTEDNLRTTSTIAGLGGLGFVSSQSGLVTISSLQTSSIAASMRGIQFLLAGTGSVTSTGVFYSQDGVTASNATLLPQATNFTDAAVSPNGFLQSPGGVEYVLAVDSPIKLYVSNNLTSWTAVGAVPTATVKSIGFGSNASLPIYVVATAGTGLNSLQFRRSTDVSFITTPTAGGFSGGGTRVAYNPASDRWVATGVDSLASTLQYTTTLTSWTASAGPTFSTVANSVIWAPGFSRFYAVGKAAVSTATIKMSADGITWSNAVSGGFANCNLGALDIAYGNVGGTTPTLVAVGEGAPGGAISTIQWSTDGLNFSNATAGGFVSTNFAAGNTIAYSATLGQWMAAGGVSSVLTSADGKAWANTAIQRPAGFTAARIFAPNAPYYTTLPIIAGPEALFQGGRQIVDTGYLNLFLATKTFGTSTFSTLTVAQLAQISSVSANTVIAPLVSTLALNVSSINGTVYGSFIGSTTFLSAASALISSATLQNLAATQGYVSSLIVDSFQLGSNAAFFNMGDVIATSLSTIQLNTGILYTNSTLLGNTSSQTAIQFYGNAGAYNQTVLAEQSTGSGLQEFVVFRGSSASDRIRMQTTGSIVFEPGVSSRLWPNVASNVTPALMINTASNVGIQTATPAFPLDVAGTARAQTISTLGLNVSSINGTVYSVFGGAINSISTGILTTGSLTLTNQTLTLTNGTVAGVSTLSGGTFTTAYNVTNFVGNGTTGSTDGTGTNAPIYYAWGLSPVDNNGTFYAVDGNNKIRRITAAGVITTVAGSGTPASTDGTGTNASFNTPTSITFDTNGNLYVVDFFGNKIRMITPAGVVTTLAGSGSRAFADGTGTNASFNYPWGIVTDNLGNLYISDRDNGRIRKLVIATGVVTTLAGNGSGTSTDGTGTNAIVSYPTGLTIDPATGTMIVADGSRIRRVTFAGVVTTIAGNTTNATIDGVGTNASFNGPLGFAADSAGNIFVGEQTGYRIRKITPAGLVTTIAGSGTATTVNGIGASASFNQVLGVTIDSFGNIYAFDLGHYIRKLIPIPSNPFTSYTGSLNVSTIYANTGINSMRLGADYGVVTTFAGSGANSDVNGTGTGASFNTPEGIVYDPFSNCFYVVGRGSTALRKVTLAGVVTTLATGMASARNGVTVDPAGNIYVVQGYNINIVNKITPAGVVTVLAGSGVCNSIDGTGTNASFNNPYGLTCDPTGNYLYVSDCAGGGPGGNKIRRVTLAGAVVTTVAGTGGAGSTDGNALTTATFSQPQGLACDSAGNLYINDGTNKIRKLSLAGVVTTVAGSGSSGGVDGVGTNATFSDTRGIVVDPVTNNLYVADATGAIVRKITPAGVVTTIAGQAGVNSTVNGLGSDARLNLPTDITIDPAGNLYTTDQNGHVIRKITLATTLTNVIISTSGSVTAPIISTLTLNVGSINGQTPIYLSTMISTVAGLNSNISSMIDPTELTSTVVGLGSIGIVSTLGVTSTIQGLGSAGYVSTATLNSSINALKLSVSTNYLSAAQIQVASGYISSLTVDSLALGSNAAFFTMGDVLATSISTFQVNTGVLYMNSTFIGNASSLTALQFYGNAGAYNQTVLAEVSTGSGLQEFLVFRGSSASDRIRMQTTGTIVFEPGVTSRLWPNVASNVTPAMVINTASNVGIQTATPVAPLDVAGTARAQTLSTLALNVCTINGFIPWQPSYLQSTVQGLGQTYVSTASLVSSMASLRTSISTINISAATIQAAQLSTLNLQVCTINGAAPGTGSGSGTTFVGSTIYVSAATIQASTLSSLTFQANTGYVSSLTVDSLQIGSNAAFISLGDSIATSLSTIVVRSGVVNASQLNASTISTTTLFTQSTLLGISSLQTAIQFYGLTGNYTNTVLAEQSTSATSQEFIVFRGSSATDRIRMQTTGNIVFEPGVTARMWPNTPSNVTPAMIINTASNIGILTATPTVPLDVAGVGRFQMLSTLNLQVCTINGAAPGTGSGGTTFVGSTIFLSSAQGFISSLTVNALTIGTTAGFTVMGDVIAASMSTINLNVSTINGALPGSGSGSSSAFNGSTITVSTLQLFDPALTFSSLGNLYVRSSLLLYNSTVVAGARQVQSQMFTF